MRTRAVIRFAAVLTVLALASCSSAAHHSEAARRNGAVTTPLRGASLPLAPSTRFGASATFDAANGTVVLFGGYGAYGSLSDTWTWDGARWHQEHPRTVPPARSGAIMAYDPLSKEVLMASGMAQVPLSDPCRRTPNHPPSCTPPALFRQMTLAGDLWGWDGHDWHHRLADAQQPLPISMTTDDRDGYVVLLRGSAPALATFTWSGTRWIYRRPSRTPIGNAQGIGVGYDPALGRVLAIETYQPGVCMPHSGCTQPARTIATTWDGNAWRPSDPGAPSSRAGLLDPTTLTYDPAGHGMLAFDTHGNTWRLTNQHWVLVATVEHSPHQQFMAIASDPAHHQVIAFGGYPPINKIPTSMPGNNDTWIWNGTTWQQHTAPVTAPIPPPAPTTQRCGLNGPALVPGSPQDDGTSIRLTFSDLFVVAPCHLTVSVRLVLVNAAGHPLAVTGNPATSTFDADVTGTFSSVLEGGMTWTNPCAPPGGAQVQIFETGQGALPGPLTVALSAAACAHPTTSTLTADPLTVHAPRT